MASLAESEEVFCNVRILCSRPSHNVGVEVVGALPRGGWGDADATFRAIMEALEPVRNENVRLVVGEQGVWLDRGGELQEIAHAALAW